MSVGVVIGRFQVAQLHEGHIALLSAVAGRCTRLVVLVGVTPAPFNAHDPLPFFCREDAIRSVFPAATVLPLPDRSSDDEWSRQIDDLIRPFDAFSPITIFGGRDSALPHYTTNRYHTEALPIERTLSGTEIRKATELGYSYEFRTGMIYAAQQRFPTSFQAVDIAILRDQHLLVGRKVDDPADRWRFPGGFVDPSDRSLEIAAKRELVEECGWIETSRLAYAGSARVPDWRFRSSVDQVLTSLFVGTYVFGAPKAGDDLAALMWLPRHAWRDSIHPNHLPLVELLMSHLEAPTNDAQPTAAHG